MKKSKKKQKILIGAAAFVLLLSQCVENPFLVDLLDKPQDDKPETVETTPPPPPGTVATPKASPAGGIFNQNPTTVTLTTGTDGADIYYTIDNTNPTDGSTKYENPFTLTVSGTGTALKAIAVKEGMVNSAVMTETYYAANVATSANIDERGVLTITVAGDTYTITDNAGTTGPYPLDTRGVWLKGVTGNRRIVVTGGNAQKPLHLRLDGVTIDVDGDSYNAINLETRANVLLQVDSSTNTLTLTQPQTSGSYAALRVGTGSTIQITSNTAGSLTATATSYMENGGAAIGGNHDESAGSIIIDGNVRLTATAALNNGAGIGGGRYGSGGTIKIGGNAVVEARSVGGDAGGAGIGGGRGGTGGTITIDDNAQVTATGGKYGAGIGGGSSTSATPENTVITITGNAKVYAQGGKDGTGIGSGDGDSGTSGAKITIGTGTDYPVVIAKSGDTIEANGLNTSAIGSGGVAAPNGSVVQIEIKSGFVVAKRMHDNAAGQDIGGAYGSGSYVRITGGSVYAANALVNPAPTKADGTTAVFPLYVPASHAGKPVRISGADYATISPDAAAMLSGSATGGLFPTTTLSATFWLPVNNYDGITSGGAGSYTANVQGAIVPYTDGMTSNVLDE